jgi:alkylation response protein AidB-like acyl-CoA dehydrogenase
VIEWNADQKALRDGLTRWTEALSDGHIERDAEGVFSQGNWKLIGESGILGLPFDERWGGLGQDLLTTMYVLEGLGEGCRDGGLSFSVTTTMCSVGVPLDLVLPGVDVRDPQPLLLVPAAPVDVHRQRIHR